MTDRFASDGDLSFRLMRDDDADHAAMTRWLNDDRVLEWFGGRDRPRSAEAIRDEYRQRTTSEGPAVRTFMLLGGRPIGMLQFYDDVDVDEHDPAKRFVDGDPEGAFGIDLFIGEPDLWDQGLGSRAIALFTGWLFEARGATVVFGDPRVSNERRARACKGRNQP